MSEAFIEQALELPPPGTAGASTQRPVQKSAGTSDQRNMTPAKAERHKENREGERKLQQTASGDRPQASTITATVDDETHQSAQATTGPRNKPGSRVKSPPPRS